VAQWLARVFLYSFVCWLSLSGRAFAQSDGAQGGDVSVFVGSFLPNQIEGVTEILPLFGGRVAFDSQAGAIEIGLANSHAYGVDFTILEMSLRGEFPLGEGMSGLAYAGGDLSWFIPIEETSRKTDTGLHFGGGAMMEISEGLWFRSEMKFMGSPGTSLSLLFGFVFR
jgi:hypothetical protein